MCVADEEFLNLSPQNMKILIPNLDDRLDYIEKIKKYLSDNSKKNENIAHLQEIVSELETNNSNLTLIDDESQNEMNISGSRLETSNSDNNLSTCNSLNFFFAYYIVSDNII